MRKRLVSLVLSISIMLPLAFCSNRQVFAATTELKVSAKASILYCANNGQVLLSHDAEKELPIASTTKIMTALLALEAYAADSKPFEFTSSMAAEGSSMYLKPGYKLTLRDCAVGMMMASGNDGANAVALHISGNFNDFAKLMNERAKQIGMKHTNFVTPSGLDDCDHCSTAYDMAVLLAYAMDNDDFADITSKTSMQVKFANPDGTIYTYPNHNRLLKSYQYCIGGKTGFTKKAGRCLVSVAEKDGVRLVAVTLNDPSDWNDHKSMFDYGFSKLRGITLDDSNLHLTIPVVGGDCENITTNCAMTKNIVIENGQENNVVRTVEVPQFVYAPVGQGDVIGEVKYTLNGKMIAQNEISVANTVNFRAQKKNIFQKILEFFGFKD
ncbi:MAG: D-alanyl-D-alanine carboxypeptidase family protein [Bacillota bacterium]|nr:D-alanyl-D-alanine carboxypeptidase family protein [Bacillota bacterium]